MKNIYTLAEFSNDKTLFEILFEKLSSQDKEYVEIEKKSNEILLDSQKKVEQTMNYFKNRKDLDEVSVRAYTQTIANKSESFGKKLIGYAQKLSDYVETNIGSSVDELNNVTEEQVKGVISYSKKLNKEVVKEITDFGDSIEHFVKNAKNLPQEVRVDDLINRTVKPPTTKVSQNVTSNVVSKGVATVGGGGGGGGGKGALIAGLGGIALAGAIGAGIAINKRKDKSKVKSHVRKGKLVKSHSRYYKPDK